jgi:hypothetical protein
MSKAFSVRIERDIEERIAEYAKRRGLYHGDAPSKGAAIRELVLVGLAVISVQYGEEAGRDDK